MLSDEVLAEDVGLTKTEKATLAGAAFRFVFRKQVRLQCACALFSLFP